ncbi:MAG: hypothetical protein RI883_547 [Bacteroidota bacterium]|jgi:hypothetical protein
MKNILFISLFALFIIACSEDKRCTDCKECGVNLNVEEVTMEDAVSNSKSTINQGVDSTELNASIAKIEEKYGEQWDFCDCVVKGDSINKAFSKPNLPDKEFDRLSARFDEIDTKCQAFRIQDANRTPEQRDKHEKKVRKCLRDAGVKN